MSYKIDPLGAILHQDFPHPLCQLFQHQGFPLNFLQVSLSLVTWYCMMVTEMLAPVIWAMKYISESVGYLPSESDSYCKPNKCQVYMLRGFPP